ncbi:hypothetical protein P3X46_032813 [Hevea brasiliensis]|uniref:Uncharacterized protein n=2 Tax=Hevea brasiliensis TaxID=3981 RepID=A0ABQ9KFP0_HEVBR|nr:CASP-like protein 4D1 [Hevea brasiliensis]KAF2305708.1 hypothetical protein GH714_007695 [Hevea brasiliensis]KAJ9135659.1 hypothetical protein P3X46_032813 [Hevea brasiliensis]
MAPKSVRISCILRLLTLGALVASIVVLVTNKFTSVNGGKTSFKDIIAYRYVLATACVGSLYMTIQIPFGVYYSFKGKRLIRNDFLPNLDFFGDKIVAFLLATGVGAGFAVSFELKRIVKEVLRKFAASPLIQEQESKSLKFLDRANIATGLLFLGFFCVAILSVLSSINRTSSSKGFFLG